MLFNIVFISSFVILARYRISGYLIRMNWIDPIAFELEIKLS